MATFHNPEFDNAMERLAESLRQWNITIRKLQFRLRRIHQLRLSDIKLEPAANRIYDLKSMPGYRPKRGPVPSEDAPISRVIEYHWRW
jgi:hypothetical protein